MLYIEINGESYRADSVRVQLDTGRIVEINDDNVLLFQSSGDTDPEVRPIDEVF